MTDDQPAITARRPNRNTMFESLARALAAGLGLWEHKEKHKYQDRLIELRKRYYEEDNKDPAHRSDGELDRIRFELRILADSFSASVKGPHA